jgi:acyl-CoA synthetase (AMP-forming)/AMP-acid ligase II
VNIADLLTARAAASGDQMAVIDESGRHPRTLSFGELDQLVSRTAACLHDLGLRPGDRVLVLQPLSLDLCVVLVAILRAGLVAVFVDPSAGLPHLESCCRMTAPRAFIGSGKAHLLRLVSPGLRRIPLKWRSRTLLRRATAAAQDAETSQTAADLPPSAPALIRFTSGSTGAPKAAVRTHGFLVEQLRAIESNLHLQDGQIDLVTMPMFMLPNLAAGVTSIIPAADVRAPGRIDPAPLVRQIQERRVDRLTASPALFHRLADYCARHQITLDSLRRLDTGGAPVFPGLLDALRRLAPQAEIVAVYGSTEAEPIALLRHDDISDTDRQAMATGAGLLAGRPVPDLRVRLLRVGTPPPLATLTEPEFEALCAPPGQPGEIVVSGPHVHPGQAEDAGGDPTKLRSGNVIWHRTGDAGRFDDTGRLWLLGRTSARLEDARGVLYPFQLEAAVLTDGRVRHAALVAIKGRRVLVVQPTDPSSPPPLPEWVRSQVDEVRLMRRLPLDRRHNAKVDYVQLLKQL